MERSEREQRGDRTEPREKEALKASGRPPAHHAPPRKTERRERNRQDQARRRAASRGSAPRRGRRSSRTLSRRVRTGPAILA